MFATPFLTVALALLPDAGPAVAPTETEKQVDSWSAAVLDQFRTATPKKDLAFLPGAHIRTSALVTMGFSGTAKKEAADNMKFAGRDAEAEVIGLYPDLSKTDDSSSYVRTATAIWLKDGIGVHRKYLAKAQMLGAGVYRLLPSSEQTLNDWSKENTDGLIPTPFANGSLASPPDCMVTTSAVIGAKWKVPFLKSGNSIGSFDVSANETKRNVSYMSRVDNFSVVRGKNFRMLSLPTADGKIKVALLLPDKDVELSDVAIDTAVLQKARTLFGQQPPKKQTKLKVPVFKMQSEVNYVPALKKLGVKKAFTDEGEANFGELCSKETAYISNWTQTAVIEFGPDGFIAAGLEIVKISTRSARTEEEPFDSFDCTKPFAMLGFVNDRLVSAALVYRPQAPAAK